MSTFDISSFRDSILGKSASMLDPGWVWSKSPLGPLQTFLTVMTMVAFGRKGYRSALQEVFTLSHGGLGWGASSVPTPSALTQARRKMSEDLLRGLFGRLSKESGHITSRARLRYRDFRRVVAADGTLLALASSPELKKHFGCPHGEHLAPQARMSMLWDLGANVPVDWRMGSQAESENGHLNDMLGSLGAGDLLLADRLYPSRSLMSQCMDRGIHYIFRVKIQGDNTMREVKAFLASSSPEHVIEMHDHPGKMLRFVRGYRPGSEDCVFVTSLTNTTEHPHEAIADLYQRRWGIETAYREGKTWHGLDNLPGSSLLHIQQEIAALMIFWLMEGELEGQARHFYAKEISQQPDVDPAWKPAEGIAEIPVRFNRKLAANAIPLIINAACQDIEIGIKQWHRSITYLWQNRSLLRPGRTYRRTSQKPHILRKRDAEATQASREHQIKRVEKGGSKSTQ